MMRRLVLPLLIALVSLIAVDRLAADRLHADPIKFEFSEPRYQFAEWLAFSAHASGSISITQATVFYQAGSALPVSQPADRFAAATEVDLAATIVFAAARPAAFSIITYWWEVVDVAGNRQQSELHTFKYIDNRFAWQILDEGHARIYWYQGDSVLSTSAAKLVADTLPRLEQQLSVTSPDKLDVYIYAALDDLRSAIELAGHEWLGGQARPELGVVLIAIPSGPGADLQLRRDLPHELTHLMMYLAAFPRYDAVPAWLDEGLATLNEAEPNPAQAVALQQALEAGQAPSLEAMCGTLPTDATEVLAAYAQSRGVVQQIVDAYGSTGIQALLAAYRDGASCAGGVERGLNTTLTGLELKWRAALSPDSGATTLAKGFGPWLIILAVVSVPLIVMLTSRKRS
ncbi:MAG: hypothetical protein HY870_08810 [Chloroflexi bacterium]|nr:hypothetical protein [Chloroflexota bacterium]